MNEELLRENSEYPICVPDMIRYILSKWKWLLLLGVLGAILGFAYGKHEAAQTAVEAQTAADQAAAQAAAEEEARSALTDEERTLVETVYDSYRNTRQIRDEQQNYLDQSVWLNLPYDAVPTERLLYSVDSDSAQEGYRLVESAVENADFYSKVAKKLGEDYYSSAFMSELIAVELSDTQNITVLSADDAVPSSVIVIRLHARNETDCKKFVDLAREQITGCLAKSEGSVSSIAEKVRYITSSYQTAINTELLSSRQNVISNITGLTEKLASFTSPYGFSEAESNYFNKLVQNGGLVTEEQTAGTTVTENNQNDVGNTDANAEDINEPASAGNFVDAAKGAIPGALMGVLLAICVLVCAYVVGGKIRCPEQLEAMGLVTLEEKLSEKRKYFCRSLAWVLQEHEISKGNSIFLALDAAVPADDDEVAKIQKYLENQNYVVVSGRVGMDEMSIPMKDAAGILLIGKKNDSFYETMRQEALLLMQEKTYLGCALA